MAQDIFEYLSPLTKQERHLEVRKTISLSHIVKNIINSIILCAVKLHIGRNSLGARTYAGKILQCVCVVGRKLPVPGITVIGMEGARLHPGIWSSDYIRSGSCTARLCQGGPGFISTSLFLTIVRVISVSVTSSFLRSHPKPLRRFIARSISRLVGICTIIFPPGMVKGLQSKIILPGIARAG